VKSVVWCFSLLLVFVLGCPGGNALAESMPAIDGPSIVPANNTRNTVVDRLPVGPKAAIYTNTVRTSAGAHPNSGEVKQSSPPQGSPPSLSKPKASFWQWLSGRKVDCSSGVCTFK